MSARFSWNIREDFVACMKDPGSEVKTVRLVNYLGLLSSNKACGGRVSRFGSEDLGYYSQFSVPRQLILTLLATSLCIVIEARAIKP